MGTYCDICGAKDESIKRVEIKCTSDFGRNHNYIIKHYELCHRCYIELYTEIVKVTNKF